MRLVGEWCSNGADKNVHLVSEVSCGRSMLDAVIRRTVGGGPGHVLLVEKDIPPARASHFRAALYRRRYSHDGLHHSVELLL